MLVQYISLFTHKMTMWIVSITFRRHRALITMLLTMRMVIIVAASCTVSRIACYANITPLMAMAMVFSPWSRMLARIRVPMVGTVATSRTRLKTNVQNPHSSRVASVMRRIPASWTGTTFYSSRKLPTNNCLDGNFETLNNFYGMALIDYPRFRAKAPPIFVFQRNNSPN